MHLEDMTFITKHIHLGIEKIENIAYNLVHIEWILKVHRILFIASCYSPKVYNFNTILQKYKNKTSL